MSEAQGLNQTQRQIDGELRPPFSWTQVGRHAVVEDSRVAKDNPAICLVDFEAGSEIRFPRIAT
jgi:hypothetical protein